MTNIVQNSETPAHGQQIITATAFIHHRFNEVDKVFLAKRAETKKLLPGANELPGGHIDFGEDPVAGLEREIMEELGMAIKVGDPFYVFTYTNEVKGSHSIEIVYFARFVGQLDEIKINPEDHSGFAWFSENELSLAATAGKAANDIEFLGVKKGFALLRGEPLDF